MGNNQSLTSMTPNRLNTMRGLYASRAGEPAKIDAIEHELLSKGYRRVPNNSNILEPLQYRRWELASETPMVALMWTVAG
jgi:hypothetical protein